MNDPQALTRTPLRKRLTQVVSYGLSGGWFTPEMPLQPQHQETAGRRFDYQPGYNISTRPRRDSGIDFQSLRNFAQYYDILRMLIEKRKDQIVNFEWSIVPSDKDKKAGAGQSDAEDTICDQITAFLKKPDGRKPWNQWLRCIVEDFLVLDGVAIWPVYQGMQLKSLELVDPATIKIVIDESGRRPEPPFPAYQQVLHGVPTADFMKDELHYFIGNPASNRVYGLSKVEQALITIQIGLRREIAQLQFFTEGNVPAALAGVPDTWNSNQIEIFQKAFDGMMQGDTGNRRKIWFVPGDVSKNIKELRSEEATLKGEFDEWIIRLLCFVFGVTPTPFVKQVNRATAESAAEEAREEGLGPTLQYIKDIMDDIIRNCMRIQGYEFQWSTETDVDPTSQSQIDDLYIRNGTLSVDEVRQQKGLEALGVENMVYLSTGPVPLKMFVDGSAPNLQPKEPPTPPGGDKGDKPSKTGGQEMKESAKEDEAGSDPISKREVSERIARPFRLKKRYGRIKKFTY